VYSARLRFIHHCKNFFGCCPAEVPWDGMFETACGDCKIESSLAVREIHPTVNQARGESISGADPIYRMSDVKLAASIQ
jgi:hypothetical protein